MSKNLTTFLILFAAIALIGTSVQAVPHGGEAHGASLGNAPGNAISSTLSADMDGTQDAPHDGMKMFFNTDNTAVFLLFPQLQPKNGVQYALAVIGTFILSVINSSSENIRIILFRRGSSDVLIDDVVKGQTTNQVGFLRRVLFTLFKGITTLISYAVMLLAMTFNVGLLGAIVGGVMLTTLMYNYEGAVAPKKV